MKYRLVIIQMMLMSAVAFPIRAEEAEAQQNSEPQKSDTPDQPKSDPEKATGITLAGVKDYLGLDVYLQGSYLYNTANPKDQTNLFRALDHQSNSFSPDMAEIQLWRKPNTGEVGYKLKVMAGSIAELIHSNGLGASTTDVPFDLTEAYVNYVAPLGSGLTIQLGKFVTCHGAEVLEAKDNINYSYSFLFTYAIPITHTGLMVSYTFANILTATGYVVNGWDNALDNNRAKTYGISFNFAPIQYFSAVVNFMAGPEQTNNDADWRYLLDVVLTAKPTTALTLVVNGDYAHESTPTGNVSWHGVDLIGKYDILSWLSGAARIEYFNDKDGVRTGIAQNLMEVTITPEFRLPGNLTLRPEYRHDWSDRATFHASKGQDTLGVGMIYFW